MDGEKFKKAHRVRLQVSISEASQAIDDYRFKRTHLAHFLYYFMPVTMSFGIAIESLQSAQ